MMSRDFSEVMLVDPPPPHALDLPRTASERTCERVGVAVCWVLALLTFYGLLFVFLPLGTAESL